MQWERSVASVIATGTENLQADIHDAALDLVAGRHENMWCEKLLKLMTTSHERMSRTSSVELNTLRQIYTDSCIVRGLFQSLLARPLDAIATLDSAIIVAGPYGIDRQKLILEIIRRIQHSLMANLSLKPDISGLVESPISNPCILDCTIPCLLSPPSLYKFQTTSSGGPFILRGYAKGWPALQKRPWRLSTYLRSVAGPGRVVPVEVGSDYRLDDWQQKIMPWDDFLSLLDFPDQPSSRTVSTPYYLAQHDLTKQFPDLLEDISLPDYIYAKLDSPDFPGYQPPCNDNQMLFNTWLGPKGTISPAHFDPYYNIYVQVAGYKSVWLAPPTVSESMYPFSSKAQHDEGNRHLMSSTLGNTSRVDVFSDQQAMSAFPNFVNKVISVSMIGTLAPGDLLFFPPGWWHAMRSESTSFSFSTWF